MSAEPPALTNENEESRDVETPARPESGTQVESNDEPLVPPNDEQDGETRP